VEWQAILVGLCVALALAYLARRGWRTWRGRAAGCGGCKCGSETARKESATPLIPVEQITARLRGPHSPR
jgi:hypothetical protein